MDEKWNATPAPAQSASMTDEEWQVHKANPTNWSAAQKGYQVFAVSFLSFWINGASSSYITGRQYVATALHVSTELSILPMPMSTLGLVFGPIIACSANV
ncbi:uncharacterized protein RCC_12225 [Ramularia collo-cygni]|uniref:Uncharacterized protein n=1 Tax=Ramularia collo-cygni TaxID=112498 RepID=A0A2D3ULR8_9PEZI|nr:uncharacterized protein RCC_12225 [Ramularia collo-cygni]CZT15392.1 uncharacterized protein RCC_12225 [Ramularia collo-cygni]